MPKDSYLKAAAILFILLMGCGRTNPVSEEISDKEAINLLISSSGYADCSDLADDGLTGFPLLETKSDSFPGDIYFLRRIESHWSRTLLGFDSGRTSAWAEVQIGSRGRLVLDNNHNGSCDTLWRPVDDQGRRCLSFRKSGGRWGVYGASPLAVQTVSPAVPVLIDSLVVQGSIGLRTRAAFRWEDQARVWAREEMPAFSPGAEVTLTVWGGPATAGDSCWAFLHRREWQAGLMSHLRLPMVRQPGGAFSLGWIAETGEVPVVRQVAVALMLGSTLFGDSTGEYSACLWTVPYIVTDSDSLPK